MLLGLDHPHTKLCPHEPRATTDHTDLAFPVTGLGPTRPRHVKPLGERTAKQGLEERLDPKSITQNLFSTRAWKASRVTESEYVAYPHISSKRSVEEIPHYQVQFQDRCRDHNRLNMYHGDDELRKRLLDFQHIDRIPQDLPEFVSSSVLQAYIDGGKPFRNKLAPFDREKPIHQAHCEACVGDATAYQYCTIRSIAHVLASPAGILSSFYSVEDPSDYTFNILDMQAVFNHLFHVEGRHESIFPSLYKSVGFVHMNSDLHEDDAFVRQYHEMTDNQASRILNVAMAALVSSVPDVHDDSKHMWDKFAELKASGQFYKEVLDSVTRRTILLWVSAYSDELAARLIKRILRVFASRTYQRKSRPTSSTEDHQFFPSLKIPTGSEFVDEIVSFLAISKASEAPLPTIPPSRKILEWARSMLQQEWDNKAEFSWSSDVGCAVEFMRMLCKNSLGS